MKLSVIVPVYNTAADGKLEYCLNSLVGQTLQDMEIIAVDDCSTDQSWDILQQFEKKIPRPLPCGSFRGKPKTGGCQKHRPYPGIGGMDRLY